MSSMAAPALPLLALACALLAAAAAGGSSHDRDRRVEQLSGNSNSHPPSSTKLSQVLEALNLESPQAVPLPSALLPFKVLFDSELSRDVAGNRKCPPDDAPETAVPRGVLEFHTSTYCTTILVGKVTDDSERLKSVILHEKDNWVVIPDKITRMGLRLGGLMLTVCDWSGSGRARLLVPDAFSPVLVQLQQPPAASEVVMYAVQYGVQVHGPPK